MKQFKVKRKHLTGEIADFPRRVVQAMVDEQVRQGNPADPSVFWIKCTAGKSQGGFNWHESLLGRDAWVGIIPWKKFYLIPKSSARNSAYNEGYDAGYDDGYFKKHSAV